MILYYSPGTRAFPVLWALEELGAEYELVVLNLKQGEQQTEEYKRLNPMMKVPTLSDGDVVVSETGAILQCVAERNPSGGLLPAIGDPARPICLRWLFFVGSNFEPAMDGSTVGPPAPITTAGAISTGCEARSPGLWPTDLGCSDRASQLREGSNSCRGFGEAAGCD